MECWGQDSSECKGVGGMESFSPFLSTADCTDPCCSAAWARDWSVLLTCLCFNVSESYSAKKSMTASLTKTDTDIDRCDLKFQSEPAVSDRVLLLGSVYSICWFGHALTHRSQWNMRQLEDGTPKNLLEQGLNDLGCCFSNINHYIWKKNQNSTHEKTKAIFAYCVCQVILKHNREHVREIVKQCSLWIDWLLKSTVSWWSENHFSAAT